MAFNGPPFNGEEFNNFWDTIIIEKLTNSMANGTADAFMKCVGKVIRTAMVEGKDWSTQMNKFLRNIRSAPDSATGIDTYLLMFNRNTNSMLPNFGKKIWKQAC